MTSDAKVGLLLSLIFIFIIAFIINGLPNFFRGADNNRLTQDYLNNLRNYDADVTHGAREAVKEIGHLELVRRIEANRGRSDGDISARFEQPLPQVRPAADEAKTASIPAGNKPSEARVVSVEPARPRVYIVQEGDNLALIAERFYGPEEGNKRRNIEMIFRANRDVLSSPDMIVVGQRLLIPPLRHSESGLQQAKAETGQALKKNEFAESKPVSLSSIVTDNKTGRNRRYTVREGDSLWRIAGEQLGNPGRYNEIVSLNKDIIEDEEQLTVGMQLRLPGR